MGTGDYKSIIKNAISRDFNQSYQLNNKYQWYFIAFLDLNFNLCEIESILYPINSFRMKIEQQLIEFNRRNRHPRTGKPPTTHQGRFPNIGKAYQIPRASIPNIGKGCPTQRREIPAFGKPSLTPRGNFPNFGTQFAIFSQKYL